MGENKDISLKIGRNNANRFVINDLTVSNFHAVISLISDQWVLKDLDSANGTFVNGAQIFSKIITGKDTITFGKKMVESKELFAQLTELKKDSQVDFSKEFEGLKKHYEDYQYQVQQLKKKQKIKPMLLRGMITLSLMIIAFLLPIDISMRSGFTVIIGLIGGTITTLSVNDSKLKGDLDALFVVYAKKIVCPKCRLELIGKSWLYWKEKGNCPKCDCKWV